MNRHDRELAIAQGRWHLAEAERLEAEARHTRPVAPAVADIAAMTPEWVEARLPAALLRQAADTHRAQARRIHDRLANTKDHR